MKTFINKNKIAPIIFIISILIILSLFLGIKLKKIIENDEKIENITKTLENALNLTKQTSLNKSSYQQIKRGLEECCWIKDAEKIEFLGYLKINNSFPRVNILETNISNRGKSFLKNKKFDITNTTFLSQILRDTSREKIKRDQIAYFVFFRIRANFLDYDSLEILIIDRKTLMIFE